jgi:hypothetical protein
MLFALVLLLLAYGPADLVAEYLCQIDIEQEPPSDSTRGSDTPFDQMNGRLKLSD